MHRITTIILASLFLALPTGCTDEGGECTGHEGGEHEGEGEEGGDEGEENGTELQKDESHDEERKGTHLILNYVEADNMFVGTVENISADPLDQVRVEVHLSNGTELGPTPDISLDPDQIEDIELDGDSEPFDTWSAHAEVGADEHGSSDCAEGEHEGDGGHE
jgi:hypothetical protein